MQTPKAAGFHMPAEWTPHQRCWMAWPCRPASWGNDAALFAEAKRATAAVAQAIAAFEPVVMIARPEDAAEAHAALGRDIPVVDWPISDSWTRDTGPSFLIDGAGTLAGVDWGFNAWGLTYPDFAPDAAVARRILEHAGARRFPGPMILEGGAVSVDGEGTVLTTEQCLLHPNRNPHLTRADIEAVLCEWLGADTVIWLKDGLENDETDGHVDEIACFAAPGKVLLLTHDDPDDPNTAILAENRARLEAATDAKGRRLEVVPLPHPRTKRFGHLGRMTPSYANFYIANGGLVAPSYGDPNDAAARAALEAAFPGREVVMVPALAICAGGGNIHCITQQEPRP